MKRMICVLLSAALTACLGVGTAFAAESREKIGKVTVDVYSSIRIGGTSEEVTATTDNENCTVDDVEVLNADGEDWTRSTPPLIEITLSTDDDHYFSSKSSSNYKLKLHGGSYEDIKFVSASYESGSDKTILVLQARFIYDKDKDTGSAAAPTKALWATEKNGIGTWNAASGAKYYNVQLYKNDQALGNSVSIYDTSYNFASLINGAGTYRFKVRSVEDNTNMKSSWDVSPEWVISEEKAKELNPSGVSTETLGTWVKAADNVRWWYRFNDGSFPAGKWQLINNVWYCFDAAGYMYANTQTPDGYWVDASGAWVQGNAN